MARELTRSPQINKLLGTIDQYHAEEVDDQAVIITFDETVAFIQVSMQAALQQQLAIATPGSAMNSIGPELGTALESLRSALDQVRRALETPQSHNLEQALALVTDGTATAFKIIDRIQAAEAKEANLSPSAYLNDLMKVGFAVADGKMDPGLFRTMMTAAIGHHHQSVALVKAPPGATAAQKAELQAACNQHLEGLREAELCFEDGQPAHIRLGLEKSNQAVKRLFTLQEAFLALEEAARFKNCMRCGEVNDVQARQCTKCHAPLPQVLTEVQSPTVDVHLDDQMRPVGHVMTETTQPLVDMVAAIQSGQKVLYELNDVLKTLEERTKALWTQLQSVDPEKHATSPEDREAMVWAGDLMTTGLKEMAEGINSMRRCIEAHNQAGLDAGVEAFLTGSDKMAEVAQAAVKMAMQMQESIQGTTPS